MLFADARARAGITGYYRPPALNYHPLFIEALARLVADHTETATRREITRTRRARVREASKSRR